MIFAPPPPSWYQNPLTQPANSFVVYNGTSDGTHVGSKNQNPGGGGKPQKGEHKGNGESDGDNAEGGKEENTSSKKKGGGGMYFFFCCFPPIVMVWGMRIDILLIYPSLENRSKETANTCTSKLSLESYSAPPAL